MTVLNESNDVIKPMIGSNVNEETEKAVVKTKSLLPINLKMFIAALSLSYFAKSLSGSYMKSTITQIERRFDISTSVVGTIDSCFEVGNLLIIAFVSYFGARLHRPKGIAAGSFVMAAGCFIMAMPHFLMGHYKYETAKVARVFNESSGIAMCTPEQSQVSISESIDSMAGIQRSECEKHGGSLMWVVVLIGNLLRGIGETPIIPLGLSYIDDFAKEENSAFYVGIVQTVSVIGPLAGYMLGSLCAKLYVDIGYVNLDDLSIGLQDIRWVGAWWLGFLVVGAVHFFTAIPFLFLPKSLPKEGEGSQDIVRKSEASTSVCELNPDVNIMPAEHEATISEIIKDFLPSLKRLMGNSLYVLYLVITVLKFNAFVGMITYMPKYMEQQYGGSVSKVNFLIGIFNLPILAIGIFLGGLIMKYFKPNLATAAILGFLTSLVDYFLTIGMFGMYCDNAQVAGITVTYEGIKQLSFNENTLLSDCNFNCSCSAKTWDPVCGVDGIAYVSPCLAGCASSNGTARNEIFHNCSCIASLNPQSGNFSAVLGQCPRQEKCTTMMYAFLITSFFCCLVYAIGVIPGYMVLIRILSTELKSFGVGVHMLVSRLAGGIPSPMYFGALIDTTCMKWGTRTCGGRGACRMYDTSSLRFIYLGLTTALNTASHIPCVIIIILLNKQIKQTKLKSATNPEAGKRLTQGNMELSHQSANSVKIDSEAVKVSRL
ncbi:solute carrier organic anion transporter family member 1A2-like [Protopterus annectens]|uniref:solute carrier organic anion transporter family member 1A2-like n=1 Tax=Protopterus annectens TaxID=7888 RepID=UPI001CF9EBD1|nr:solute carrier organic anion transporter family member 1A2-like [Protopterus annectens]XP_043943749.1 solute carrier organic anion transporter family member 1A2-like [Protopterus annectens]